MSAVVAGRVLRQQSHLVIALTDIYGINRSTAKRICEAVQIAPEKKVKDLTESDLESIRGFIVENLTVEGDKRREVITDIENLKRKGCNRGIRHRRGLPVNGQRTKTNARTRKRLAGKRR